MGLVIQTDLDLPDPMKNPEFWIQNSLKDLFFLATNVLSHGKRKEYRDLNRIHMELCDFVDQEKDPHHQKLVLMFRDGLKSSIARADIIQWMMRKRYRNEAGKIGLYCGVYELGEDSLDKVMTEIFSNELLQTFFYKYLPRSKYDCRVCAKEKVRYEDLEIDIGSPQRSLTGHHYEGIINDNLVNELNSQNLEQRKTIIRKWQQQESLLAEDAWEKVYETTWEVDDLAGVILDPDGKFDFKKLYRKPAYIFMSKIGYKVFSCPARGPDGKPVFPEKVDEVYLERKRRKQGPYIFSRMYELQPVPSEEQVLKPEWLIHYDELPYNFIRNMVIDCAGTTKRESSYSAISLMDWDELGTGHISFAEKRKYTPMDLYNWMKEVKQMSEEIEKRPITFIGVEKEKYGIFLSAIIDAQDPNILVWPIDIRGRPRHIRIMATVPYYEQGRIKSRPGLKQYEEEYREYYKDKDFEVDILDTVAYHLDIMTLPKKLPKTQEFVPNVDEEARRQFMKERLGFGAFRRRQINAQF